MKKNISEKKGKRKPQRGATRAPTRSQNLKFIKPLMKIAVGISLCAVVVINVDFKSQLKKVQAIANRPVAQIRIEGEFRYISKEKVQQVLEQHVRNNFVDIDLKALKGAIEQNPWIEEASVSRVWPDRLVVTIREELPIARWGKNSFINRFGQKVVVSDNSILANLPQLTGPAGMETDIASSYLEMSGLLDIPQMKLIGISVDPARSWTCEFDQGKRILLGQNNLIAKLELFVDVINQQLAENIENIKKVDLRYESGMAVEWVNVESGIAGRSSAGQRKYASK